MLLEKRQFDSSSYYCSPNNSWDAFVDWARQQGVHSLTDPLVGLLLFFLIITTVLGIARRFGSERRRLALFIMTMAAGSTAALSMGLTRYPKPLPVFLVSLAAFLASAGAMAIAELLNNSRSPRAQNPVEPRST